MIFAGIDVNIITHEKVLIAGAEALGLWTWGMCYAQVHGTDGRLPRVAVMSALGEQRRVLSRLAVRLVTAGLWIENEDGSFQVHNYGRKNQTSDEIRRRKEATAERTRRWRGRSRDAIGDAVVTLSECVSDRASLQPPLQDNTTTTRSEIGTASPPTEPGAVPKSRRKPETPCPESGASAGEIRDWVERWAIPDGHGEFQHFLDHHRKNDKRWRDWSAAWRTWLKNAPKFGPRGSFTRGAEITKQPTDNEAPWMKLPEVG